MTWFDRFADAAGRFTSRAWFFVGCVALIVVWVPSYLVIRNVDTWQLWINTVTTCVTFLLVGLAANQDSRANTASQAKQNEMLDAQRAQNLKLDAIAAALGDLMEHLGPDMAEDLARLRRAIVAGDDERLQAAVGLERRTSSTDDPGDGP